MGYVESIRLHTYAVNPLKGEQMKILYEDNDYKNILFVDGNCLTVRHYNENGTTHQELTVHKNTAQVTADYPSVSIRIEIGSSTYVIKAECLSVMKTLHNYIVKEIFG